MQPKESGDWVVRAKNHGSQRVGYQLQLLHVARSFAEEQVDVDGGDGSAVQRCGHVSDQDGFEAVFVECFGHEGKFWLRIHLFDHNACYHDYRSP